MQRISIQQPLPLVVMPILCLHATCDIYIAWRGHYGFSTRYIPDRSNAMLECMYHNIMVLDHDTDAIVSAED